ncbi:MAG: InlB B-repeat-containing protein [Clostridia bacterium]|nr:InlB B-repeat-containing protein [Clostridia bacterium]
MKKNKGISMLSLVITIIVIIILAAVAFANSTKTIDEANFSNYTNDVSEVGTFFKKTSVEMHGSDLLKNNPMRDEQIYNFVAKGGETFDDFLKPSDVPDYTIIEEDARIGMELPVIKVESGTGKRISIKYAATRKGEIFTWPPYDYADGLYITDTDTVEDKMQTVISVGSERFTIAIDENDGSLLPAPGIPVSPEGGNAGNVNNENNGNNGNSGNNGENGEGNNNQNGENGEEIPEEVKKYIITFSANGGSGSMASVEVNENTSYTLPSCGFTPATNYVFESWQVNGETKAAGDKVTITANTTIKAIWKAQTIAKLGDLISQGKIKQGTVIKYTPTSKSLKLGNDETGATNSQQTTVTTAEWRVLYTDGGSALITTYAPVNAVKLSSEVGYKNGAAAITKLCKTLYSGHGLTARSLTIEDIEKATGIDTYEEIKAKYSSYKEDKYAFYLKGVNLNEVTPPNGYEARRHSSSYQNGFTEPRFFVRDSGGIKSGDYWTPTVTNPVCITSTYYYYYNSGLTGVMNNSYSWLASPCVNLYSGSARLQMRIVDGFYISSDDLCYSYGTMYSPSYGVRPAVSLDASLLIDTSNGSYTIYED